MVFNSLEFAIFFIIFFFLYWIILSRDLKKQNFLILLGSYVFYAFWDWRFLSLLIGSSLISYFIGIYIGKNENEKQRRILISIAILQGLGSLLFFKYFNFFIDSFVDVFALFNSNLNYRTLNIILPLGISFYTFRLLSYLFDIYNGKIKPTADWVVFFTYVSFFPSLLAGPIDRSKTLIPQLEKKRIFEYNQATDGLRQILWGVFKKVVIADNCVPITNQIFDNYQTMTGSTLLLGAFICTIQFYADFSGYSDMAIGIARLLGFNITKNFNFPFFAQNIAEFWKKWHISLTTWMTEYVYTPLSFLFRDFGKSGMILAIIINFILVGLWHGASWTYIIFGFVHGCLFIPLILRGTISQNKVIAKDKIIPSFREFTNVLGTFTLVSLTTILFRANNIGHAINYISKIFSSSLFSNPYSREIGIGVLPVFFLVGIFLIIEWLGREQEYGIAHLGVKWPRLLRWGMYYSIILVIFFFAGKEEQFTYFKY